MCILGTFVTWPSDAALSDFGCLGALERVSDATSITSSVDSGAMNNSSGLASGLNEIGSDTCVGFGEVGLCVKSSIGPLAGVLVLGCRVSDILRASAMAA